MNKLKQKILGLVTAVAAAFALGSLGALPDIPPLSGLIVPAYADSEPVLVTTWADLKTALSADGTVTLTDDITAGNSDSHLSVPSGVTVTLDLNGHKIDRNLAFLKVDNVIEVTGELTLTDSSMNKTGTITGGSGTSNIPGGGVNVKGGKFTMNGGTISGNRPYYGGGVWIDENGTFTMNDGSISGNTASGTAGGIYVKNGTFTMSGGMISGNTASNYGGGVYVYQSGKFEMSGGTISGNTANNYGGVYVSSNATFTMSGGTISGNTATKNGGGVYVSENSTFTMSGGTITGNSAGTTGGGIYVDQSGKLEMSGGTISGNSAGTTGGGVNVDTSATFTMSGGAISGNTATDDGGGVYVSSLGTTFNLSGKPKITGNVKGGTITDGELSGGTVNNARLYDSDNLTINVTGELKDGAEIGITKRLGVFAVSGGSHTLTESDVAKFTSDVPKQSPVFNSSECKAEMATDWGSIQAKIINGENNVTITLTDDVTAESVDSSLEIPEGKTVTLDLNGHTLDRNLSKAYENSYAINVVGTLILKDSSEAGTGKITGSNNSNFGGGVYVYGSYGSGGTFIMTGGTITGNNASKGGGVYVDRHATFTMTGGTITGNSISEAGGGVFVAYESSEHYGTFNISGSAKITGNYFKGGNASNVYLCNNGFYEGIIINVTGALSDDAEIGISTTSRMFAQSANDYTLTFSDAMKFTCDNTNYAPAFDSEVYMEPAWTALKDNLESAPETYTFKLKQDITAGSNDSALIVPAGKKITLDLNGYTINRNLTTSTNNGYVIKVLGNLNLTDSGTGGKITGGNDSGNYGGGVYVAGNAKFTMQGGTISGCSSDINGGGVLVSNGSIFTMTGGTISGCSADDYGGGGVFVVNGATFTMQGGEIRSCSAKSGGGVYVGDSATFTMTGGTISGNSVSGNGSKGGGVYNYAIFAMSGGTISGNSASGNGSSGGGVYNNAIFTMTGGTISGCSADGDGGGVYVFGGTFTMSGGTISGNTTPSGFGGVYVDYGVTFNISGAPNITGNVKGGIKNASTGYYINGTANNVILFNFDTFKATIKVTGALTDGAAIAVNNTEGVFAENGEGYEKLTETDVAKFTCDDPGYVPVINSEGKAAFNKSLAHSDITVDEIADQTYTGSAITPSVTVKDGDTTLEQGTDYTVSYSNNINVANKTADNPPTVTITGTGSYAGETTADFTISPKPVTVMAKAQSVELNGSIETGADQATLTNAVTGHTLTAVTLTASSTAAATTNGTITPSLATIKSGTTDVTANYDISYEAGVLTVTKIKAKVTTVPTANNRTYDGTAADLLTGGTSETSFEYSTDGTTWSNTVPQGKKADTYTVYYRAAEDNNHTVGYAGDVSVTIGQAALTVSGATATGRNYNQEKTVAVTAVALSEVIGNDAVAVDTTGLTGTLESADVGTYRAVTLPTGLTLTGDDAGNYKLTQPTAAVALSAAIDITKADHENKTLSASTRYGTSGSANLSTLIESLGTPGTATVTSGSDLFSVAPAVSEEKLTYTLADVEGNVGKTATVEVPVENSKNYNDYKIVVTITVINCDHATTELRDVVAATCLSGGYSGDSYCTNCGIKLADGHATSALGHSYSGEITTEATCTTSGVRTYTCTRCGAVTSETISALGHDYQTYTENEIPATCTDKGSYDEVVKCSRCGKEKSHKTHTTDALGHIYKKGECIRCGAADPDYSGGEKDAHKIYVSDATGKLTGADSMAAAFRLMKDKNAAYTVFVTENVTESALTFPTVSGITFSGTGKLTLAKTLTRLAPHSSLTIDCAVSNAAGKSIAIAMPAKSTLTVTANADVTLGAITGKSTATFLVNADTEVESVTTFDSVTVAKGAALTVNNKMTGVDTLNGAVNFTGYRTTNPVKVTNIGTAEFTLTQGVVSGKAAITPVTVNKVADNLKLTVVDINGEPVTLENKTVVAKAGSTDDIAEKMKITNTDENGDPLALTMNGKNVVVSSGKAAQNVLVTGSKGFKAYAPDLTDAFALMTDKKETYTVEFLNDVTESKLTFPSCAGLTLTGEGTLTLTGTTAKLAANSSLTIDCEVVNDKKKAIAVSVPAKATFTITDNAVIKLGALTGKSNSTLIIPSDLTVESVSTFGSVTVADGATLTVTKKLASIGTLNGNVALTGFKSTNSVKITTVGTASIALPMGKVSGKNAVAKVTVSKITNGLTLNIVDAKGKPAEIETGMTVAYAGTKTDISDKITLNAAGTYTLSQSDKEIVAIAEGAKALLELDGVEYYKWTDVIKAMTDKKKDYTLKLLGDYDIGAKLTLPLHSKYKSLTIDGNGYTLTFVGTTVTLTNDTTLRNLTLTALNSSGKAVKYTISKKTYNLTEENVNYGLGTVK